MMFSFHQLVPFLHSGKHDRSLKLIDGVYEFVIQGCGVLREVCKSLAALDAYMCWMGQCRIRLKALRTPGIAPCCSRIVELKKAALESAAFVRQDGHDYTKV
jgi:hypothetical protein